MDEGDVTSSASFRTLGVSGRPEAELDKDARLRAVATTRCEGVLVAVCWANASPMPEEQPVT